MEKKHVRVVRKAAIISKIAKNRVIHHLTYHRLEWFAAIGTACFCLGWYMHSESFKHFAEFTGVPVLEAFLSRGEE